MKYLKYFESRFSEYEILEDVSLEYLDKYHLVDYKTIENFGDFWKDDNNWGWFHLREKYQTNDKLTIYVKKDKVDEDEFYEDMERLNKRLESMGFGTMTKKYNKESRSESFGFSLTLITKSTPLR